MQFLLFSSEIFWKIYKFSRSPPDALRGRPPKVSPPPNQNPGGADGYVDNRGDKAKLAKIFQKSQFGRKLKKTKKIDIVYQIFK